MTTIKYLTIIIISLLLGLRFTTVDRNYALFTPKASSLTPHIDNFKISQSFDLADDKLILFGTKTAPIRGVGLVLYDSKSKQTVFQDISTNDKDFIKPYFFKTTLPSDPIIFLCTTGAEYTYGVSIYTFHKNAIKSVGYMDVALNENPMDMFLNELYYPSALSTDPSPWTIININDSITTFSFSKPVSTDFQGQQQKNYKAGELTYQFKDGKLTMRTK
jgi:hypothetical protein